MISPVPLSVPLSHVISITPLTSLTLELSRTRKVIDVRRMGAKGDGVTDDTEAFRSAMKDMEERGGGVLLIPEGTFCINPLDIRTSGIIILGAGPASVIMLQKQVLKKTEKWGLIRFYSGDDHTPIRDCHIAHLTLDGNATVHEGEPGGSHECLTVKAGTGCSVQHVRVINAIRNGIQADGSRDLLINACIVEHAGGSGIHLSNARGGCEYCSVLNSRVSETGHRFEKAGITQNTASRNNHYIRNYCESNFQNYRILNAGAVFIDNISAGVVQKDDDLEGVSVLVEGNRKIFRISGSKKIYPRIKRKIILLQNTARRYLTNALGRSDRLARDK